MAICLVSRQRGTKRTLLFSTFEAISWLQIPRLLKQGFNNFFRESSTEVAWPSSQVELSSDSSCRL